ncbi:MAG: hypothetical protein ACI4EI_09505 [Muricoprocola sp.]
MAFRQRDSSWRSFDTFDIRLPNEWEVLVNVDLEDGELEEGGVYKVVIALPDDSDETVDTVVNILMSFSQHEEE